MEEERVRMEDYAHSPAHYAVALGDLGRLHRLLTTLPHLANPSRVLTEDDSAREERIADLISAVVDRRDVPLRDTPLHLAVRLGRPLAFASALAGAGADPSLQNNAGWTPLQEALCLRRSRRPPPELNLLLLRHHRASAWAKFRRRLPPLVAALRRLPDFYLELDFRFESPLLPTFLPPLRAALPSDTYRIWKRGADLRADTTLAGFDGLRVRRSPQSFLFLGSGGSAAGVDVPPGSLLVLHRRRKEIRDAFEGAEDASTPAADEADIVSEASAYRPGIDVTAAELVRCTNWRRREKTDMVGEWKAKVYEMQNVVFSFKTMRAAEEEFDGDEDDEIVPLDLHEDDEDGFLVADIPEMPPRHSCYEPRHSCYEPRGHDSHGRRSDVTLELGGFEMRRRSVDLPSKEEDKKWVKLAKVGGPKKEMVKSLRPIVWLTEDFPLKLEELMPLLDILANKVKAVRRLRELLATKFPPGTFPVKVSIPVVPTVRVVVTFTKFAHLQAPEQFFTPLSSPRLLLNSDEEEDRKAETHKTSWLRWSTPAAKFSASRSKSVSPQVIDHNDPFLVPNEYSWVSFHSKSQSVKKSKSRNAK